MKLDKQLVDQYAAIQSERLKLEVEWRKLKDQIDEKEKEEMEIGLRLATECGIKDDFSFLYKKDNEFVIAKLDKWFNGKTYDWKIKFSPILNVG